jgi:two-component system response regulator (stage 0 sporulation protein A)
MVKPQMPKSICDTVIDLLSAGNTKQENVYNSQYSLEERVSGFLRHLGIPAHLNGYKYIRSAIIHTTNDISELTPITQKLYPRLAREFQTSSCSVERSIRHAIGVSWKRGNKKLLSDVFGYSPDTTGTRQPTNSEYIAMAADDFRLRLKHETAL